MKWRAFVKISISKRVNGNEPTPIFSKTLLNKYTVFIFALLLEISIFFKLGRFDEILPLWNDNINITLPTRVYLDNALESGHFPFYNFLSGSGVPFLSIYTNSGLSPISIALALIFDYSTKIFVYEILLLNIITFTGMYLWCRKLSNEYIALISAFSFALSTYFLFQSRANIEGMGTASTIPWIFLGIVNIGQGKPIGAFQLAAAGGLAFTHGYLGLNWILIILITMLLTIAGFASFVARKSSMDSSRFNSNSSQIKLLGITLLIFLGTIFPLLTETIKNFSPEIYFRREVDPFVQSMKFGSWQTIFDPLTVRNSDDKFERYSNLFVPAPILIGLAGFFSERKRIVIPSILFFCISYASLLPNEYAVTRFLVEELPGFDLIRFHNWASIFIVFLLLTFGTIGINRLLTSEFSRNELVVLLFMLSIVFFLQINSSLTFKYLLITSVCIFLSALLLLAIRNVSGLPRYSSHYLLIFMVLITIFQMTLADKRVGTIQEFTKSEQTDVVNLAVSGKGKWPISNPIREGVFSVLGSYPNELVANQHLYFNQPVAISYTPSMNKRVLDANLSRGLQTLRPFLVNTDFESLNYNATFSNPNKINFNFKIDDPTAAIIQITYSKNFVAVVDGEIRALSRTSDDFMSILLTKSDKELVLEYKPKFKSLQLLIVMFAWLSILLGSTFMHFRKFK
jgi:hypothetical protein